MSEVLVTLAEIKAATGRKADKVRAECAELGLLVVDDWAGRPAVTVVDARELVSGAIRKAREHAAAQDEIRAACARWEAERAAVTTAAADEAQERAERSKRRPFLPGAFVRQSGPTSAEIHELRREAYRHAGAQFERRHPRPGPYVSLMFVDPSQEGSAVAAAVGALRGPAKPKAQPGMEVA
ncbi:hypothetical protein [Streptomyces sp. NPDC047928]|uniref:hypothetical protein n=1 Tax=unclassified Streptomyces TaxID=2593676 RepID=UPI00371DC118